MRIPRKLAAMVTTLTILVALIPPLSAARVLAESKIPPAPFADVYSTKYQDAVGLLHLINVVQGTGAYQFSPAALVTRAQMAVFLLRAMRENPSAPSTAPFVDVPASHWAAGSIARAAELGMVKGDTSGKYRPEDSVSFAEVATMLIRALGYESTVAPGEWPVPQVLKAQSLGLLDKVDFSAYVPASRGEVAIMLMNSIFKVIYFPAGTTLNAAQFQKASAIAILPTSTALSATQTRLSLQGTDWFGRTFSVNGSWSITSGNGTVDPSGMLTVNGSGAVTVQATYGDLTASQIFALIHSLTLTPVSTVVPVGTTVQFQATGVTGDNQSISVPVSWSATGPGTIDGNSGRLRVNGAGNIAVQATAAEQTATATVFGVASLAITPANSVLTPGQTVQLTAAAPDGTALTQPIQWSILSGGGSLSSSGAYTAGAAGHTVVQAAVGSLTATAGLDSISGFRVQPASMSAVVGTTTQFTAQIQTGTGWQNVPASWSLSNSSVGVLNTSGLLAVTGSGSAAVTATYSGLSASASVTVSGPAAALQLTSSRTNVTANGTSQATITATFVDSSGNATTAPVSQVQFFVSSTQLGTLSAYSVPVVNNQASVTFTAGTIATSGSVSSAATGSSVSGGSVSITTVTATPNLVKLSAYPATLAADGRSQTTITATMVDQDGVAVTNSLGSAIVINLAANGNAGTLANPVLMIGTGQKTVSTFFVASTSVGTSTIAGSSSVIVSPVTVSTVVVGAAARLNIRPISSTVADGATQSGVTVELLDAAGNTVTNDNTDLISLAVSGPAAVSPGSLVANGGYVTFRFSTSRAGTYTLTASCPTNSTVANATASATFTAGTPALLDLNLNPPVDAVAADGVTPVQLVARILDANGNLVSNASNAVTFTQLSHTVIRDSGSPTVNAVNGAATISVTPTGFVGSDNFQATSVGLGSSAILPVATRIVGKPSHVYVRTPSATTVAAGQSFTVSVWAEDALNHVVTNESGRTISLILSDATAVANSPQTTANGVATFTVTPTRSGNLTLTAQSGTLTADSVGATVIVNPGPLDHIALIAAATSVAADSRSVLTIQPTAVDVYGNALNTGLSVVLTLSNPTVGTLSSSHVPVGGIVTFTPTSVPGSVTITGAASVPVSPLGLTTYTVGAPSRVIVDPPQSVQAGNGAPGSVMQVKVRIADANGNTVTGINSGQLYNGNFVSAAYLSVGTPTGTTTLSNPASGYLPPGVSPPNATTTASANLVNGIAVFTFTDTRAETITFTPTLTIGNSAMQSTAAAGAITPGTATAVTLTPSQTAVNAQAGTSLTVTANLTDVFGNAVPDVGDTFSFAISSNTYLTATSPLVQTAGTAGAVLSLSSNPGSSGVTGISASSAKTGLLSPQLQITQDSLPSKPIVFVNSVYDTANILSSDPAVKVTLIVVSRILTQTPVVFVNGVQVALWADAAGTTRAGAIGPGVTSFTAYVLRQDYGGGAGVKSISALLTSSVGTGPSSDTATFTVH